MLFLKMFIISDFVLAYLLRIWHTYTLNFFSTRKITITKLALHNAYSFMVIFYVKCVVNMVRLNLESRDIIKKEHVLFHSKS